MYSLVNAHLHVYNNEQNISTNVMDDIQTQNIHKYFLLNVHVLASV